MRPVFTSGSFKTCVVLIFASVSIISGGFVSLESRLCLALLVLFRNRNFFPAVDPVFVVEFPAELPLTPPMPCSCASTTFFLLAKTGESNCDSYSPSSHASAFIRFRGSDMLGGISTSILYSALRCFGVGNGEDSGVTALMALATLSSDKLFKLSGSLILPPNKNLLFLLGFWLPVLVFTLMAQDNFLEVPDKFPGLPMLRSSTLVVTSFVCCL